MISNTYKIGRPEKESDLSPYSPNIARDEEFVEDLYASLMTLQNKEGPEQIRHQNEFSTESLYKNLGSQLENKVYLKEGRIHVGGRDLSYCQSNNN